jgi:hypothetical protein
MANGTGGDKPTPCRLAMRRVLGIPARISRLARSSTTESTEITETDRHHGNPKKVRFALRPPTCHHPTLASPFGDFGTRTFPTTPARYARALALGLAIPSRDGAPPAEPAGSPRAEGRVRMRIRNPFLPVSVASVGSVVKLRIAPAAVKSRENRG